MDDPRITCSVGFGPSAFYGICDHRAVGNINDCKGDPRYTVEKYLNVMGYSGNDVALVSVYVGDVHAKFHVDPSICTASP